MILPLVLLLLLLTIIIIFFHLDSFIFIFIRVLNAFFNITIHYCKSLGYKLSHNIYRKWAVSAVERWFGDAISSRLVLNVHYICGESLQTLALLLLVWGIFRNYFKFVSEVIPTDTLFWAVGFSAPSLCMSRGGARPSCPHRGSLYVCSPTRALTCVRVHVCLFPLEHPLSYHGWKTRWV